MNNSRPKRNPKDEEPFDARNFCNDGDLTHVLVPLMAMFDRLIEKAPDGPSTIKDTSQGDSAGSEGIISAFTGVLDDYRSIWPHPENEGWHDRFTRALRVVERGGICCLIGHRGTGKTRLSVELLRQLCPRLGRYTTAYDLILSTQATFKDGAKTSRQAILERLIQAPLLIIDEMHERKKDSEADDTMFTYLIDQRHGSGKPTIIIANVTKEALTELLGPSASDRIHDRGGIIELTGKSFRGSTR